MWLSPRRSASRFRTASSHCACQPSQPRDSSRLMKYDSARPMLPALRLFSSAIACITRQPAKPDASSRFTMNDTPLRSSCKNAARSAIISVHEFHPADSLRFSMCLSPRRNASRFRRISSHCDTHARHPFDSSRFIMWRRPRPIAASPATLRCQRMKPDAIAAFTMNETPLRSSCKNLARSATISAHEFHPADSLRLTRWLSPRRRLSRFRTASSHFECHATQPFDSPRCSM